MGKAAAQTRHNRMITVDFHDETTYFQLLDDGKAFVDWVMAFILSIGFQLKHKAVLSQICFFESLVVCNLLNFRYPIFGFCLQNGNLRQNSHAPQEHRDP